MALKKMIDPMDNVLSHVDHARLKLMRGAARTRRCHTQMVIHPQNVGEHTFSALAILDLVAPDCGKEAWRAMLYHDAPEAVTGDVPAPAKWENPELEEALRVVETRILRDHGLHFVLLPAERELLKFCDIMELVFYGIEEMQMGNRAVSKMVELALAAIRTRQLSRATLRAHALFEYAEVLFESYQRDY